MKFCLGVNCTNRVPSGPGAYCETCRPKTQAVRRGSAVERGYDARWTREAKRFLRQFPLCGMRPGGQASVMSECHARGWVTPAVLVDHVVPQRGDQALFWDREGNWQALCRECHDAKTRAGL